MSAYLVLSNSAKVITVRVNKKHFNTQYFFIVVKVKVLIIWVMTFQLQYYFI